MKFLFNIHILISILLAFALAVSCADVETETNGYASLEISLDDVSHRKLARSNLSRSNLESPNLAPSMTSSDAETILAVLMPAVKCDSSSSNSASEYGRALVDITTQNAKFVVPLDTQVKLCLYFFRETFSLNELVLETTAPEGFGESEIFSIDSETTSKTISVEFWTTSYSTVTFKIGSISSAGLFEGTTGNANLNSTSGLILDNQSFSITSEDNSSKSLVFSNVAYNSYSYDVELLGFIPANQTFLVSGPTETLDIKLTPNYVDIDWLSFDNMSITQVSSSAYATVTGNLVLDVPFELKDNVTQIISLMQVKRVLSNNIVDVSPPVALSTWRETERIDNVSYDNVTYTTLFTAGSNMPLVHGSNEFQITLSVNDESKTETIGSIDYDACVDNSTMCFSLTWGSGQDLELHSYYFPDWTHNEEIIDNETFDNSSRGLLYWIYSNQGTYTGTRQEIQLKDWTGDNGTEVQVWATDSHKVGNGTYLVYVEDYSDLDVQNFELVMSGPGIEDFSDTDNITYGPYNFKNVANSSIAQATNPQAAFFIQVANNSIVRLDNISVGDNLSSDWMEWTGPLQNSQ